VIPETLLTHVLAAGAGKTVKLNAPDVPPVVPELFTVTFAVVADARFIDGITAVSALALAQGVEIVGMLAFTHVVVNAVPFHWTETLPVKFDP
jgi:hypothetical protein